MVVEDSNLMYNIDFDRIVELYNNKVHHSDWDCKKLEILVTLSIIIYCEISPSDTFDLVNGRANREVIKRIAWYLDVSPDYILSRYWRERGHNIFTRNHKRNWNLYSHKPISEIRKLK